jgi:hypothetical protein
MQMDNSAFQIMSFGGKDIRLKYGMPKFKI